MKRRPYALFSRWRAAAALTVAVCSAVTAGSAQQASGTAEVRVVPPAVTTSAVSAPAAPAYVIGTDDVLSISFWREKDLAADVTVRPDGKVTLPLLNDVQAAGRTPEQLRDAIREVADAYLENPTPTVIVKEIKSRRVFITGQVEKPGLYPLNAEMTVLQLIAMAGGLKEFADGSNISVMRSEAGRVTAIPFNYRDVLKRRHLEQNIDLRPGDTVVVP